jgi:hypothetical protein
LYLLVVCESIIGSSTLEWTWATGSFLKLAMYKHKKLKPRKVKSPIELVQVMLVWSDWIKTAILDIQKKKMKTKSPLT